MKERVLEGMRSIRDTLFVLGSLSGLAALLTFVGGKAPGVPLLGVEVLAICYSCCFLLVIVEGLDTLWQVNRFLDEVEEKWG